METANKSKSGLIIMVVALALAFCIAAASLISSVYLFISGSQSKKEISALKAEISALKQKDDSLSGSFTALTQGDVAAMKGDVTSIKGDVEALKKGREDKPAFKLATFYVTFEPETYTDDYAGTGIITCDKQDAYLLLIKLKLKSGGSSSSQAVSYIIVPVAGGSGKFSTYDWGYKGSLQKPDYEIEMLGFFRPEAVQ